MRFCHKVILCWFGLLLSLQTWAGFYPPQLEPVTPANDTLKTSIVSNAWLAIDDQERLCVVENRKGLYCFNGDSFIPLSDNAFGLITLDNDGQKRLIFSMHNQLYQLFEGEISLFTPMPNLDVDEDIIDLYSNDNTTFFVAATNNIYYFDGEHMTKIMKAPSKVLIYAIRKSEDEVVELGTSQGVFRVDLATQAMENLHADKVVYYLFRDFALTSKGVYQENRKISDKIFHYANTALNDTVLLSGPQGLCYLQATILCGTENPNGKVYHTLIDQFGNLWASTNKGIMYAPFSYVEYMNKTTGLNSDNVLALLANNQELVIGTEQGVNILNLASGQITALANTAKDAVTALFIDDNHALWVGTRQGFYRYDRDSHTKGRTFLNHGLVTWIVQSDQHILVSTYRHGIYIYDRDGYLVQDNIEPYTKKIAKMAQCHDALYLGTRFNGLRRLDRDFQVSHYTNKRNHSVFTCYNQQMVTVDTDKKLKIFNSDLKPLKDVQLADSPNSLIVKDDQLWLLHDKYITRWHSRLVASKQYPAPLETLYDNIAVSHHHWIFAGSPQGLAIIDMERLQKHSKPAPKVLLNTRIDNTSGALTIKPRFNDLVAAMQSNNMAYRVSNNDNFTLIDSKRSLVFPEGLAHPLYIEFKGVDGMASNVTTLYAERKQSMMKSLHHHFFTVNARLLYAILLIKLFIILYLCKKNYHNQQRLKALQLQNHPQDKATVEVETKEEAHNDIEKKSLLTHYQDFPQVLEEVLCQPDDEFLLILKSCNRFLLETGRVYPAKELAQHIGHDPKKIERSLYKYFHSSAIKRYQRFYLKYHKLSSLGTHAIDKTPNRHRR
ncbi:MAG: hypothetical protein AAGB12_12810 [Pseudomonadota bacterium]